MLMPPGALPRDRAALRAKPEGAGGRVLDSLQERSWGECVGYVLDLDGHVLALALSVESPEGRR